MNVTLIPFFLAANIVVNDKLEWTFGPEYSFALLNISELYVDSKQVHDRQDLSIIKCRPKMSDNLFCLLEHTELKWCGIKDVLIGFFEMKFNESGVERITTNSSSTFMKELMQKFAKQLSTGIHAHRNFDDNYVTADVNYSVDKTPRTTCQTEYSIKYIEPEIKKGKEADFQFVILPMFDLKPDSSSVIQKSDADCYYHSIHTLKDKTAFERKFSTIYIKFESWTELMNSTFKNGTYNILQDTSYSKETIHLVLNSIKPAENKSISISADPWFSIIKYT